MAVYRSTDFGNTFVPDAQGIPTQTASTVHDDRNPDYGGNAVGTGSTPADGWTLYEFDSPDFQDYLSVTHSTVLRTTPEPGTLILFCIALLTAWGAAMRRQRTACRQRTA